MNIRKTQNSILVLATLGVYFGLVLVGATPQVLAQAAMTRQFNVKDEVEVKDDLDKKPDNEEIEAFLSANLETALSSFIEDLRKLKRQGKYRSKGSKPFALSTSHDFCGGGRESGASSLKIERNDPNEWIIETLSEIQSFDPARHWKLADVPAFIKFPTDVNEEDRCKYSAFDTEINSSDFVVRFTFSRETPQDADLFAANLNRIFLKRTSSRPDALTRQIYEFTKASSEKSQVSIVTRLPRAGLDSLLATDAK